MPGQVQKRTITHTGAELGRDSVTLSQNQTEPQRKSAILAFECPRKYESIRYSGSQHPTALVLRTMHEHDAAGAEGVDVGSSIQPIAGEEEIEDQPYPVVVAVDTDDGSEIEVVEANYAQNTVDLAEAATGTLKLYPVITEGAIQYQGVNQFGQVVGPVDRWETPIYRWHDYHQDRRGTEVNLQGSARWGRNEQLEMVLDSPQEVVWEDEDYPNRYVSTAEQQVNVEL